MACDMLSAPRRDEYSGLVGEYGVRHPADLGRDARQAAGRGLEIDQPKPFHPAGRFRQPVRQKISEAA